MKVLIFDLTGPFAHFRKIYTNSSSLSYSVPPRTTLEGLVGALLGKERDSYYQQFKRDDVHIAVRKLNKTRKIMQTLNYMRATGARDLVAAREHTQIPFEIVKGEPEVRYRVYCAIREHQLYAELQERLSTGKYAFPPYLGAAPFAAMVSYVGETVAEQINNNDMLAIVSPVNIESIDKINILEMQDDFALVKEKMPVDFTAERHPVATSDYIYDENNSPLKVRLKDNSCCWNLSYQHEDKNIIENIMFY